MVLSKAQEKIRGASDVHHEREFSIVSLQKDHFVSKSLSHPKVSLEHLFVCQVHRFSLRAGERVAHVCDRVQVGSSEVKCHPMHRCVSIAPSLLRPRRKPCQFGEKCSSPPSETISLTIAAKKLFHQEHRTWMMRVPSIPFCPLRLSIRVPFE